MWQFRRKRMYKPSPPKAVALSGRVFRPREWVQATLVDGETALMDLQRDQYYLLDDVGTMIWGLMSERLSFEQIVDRLEMCFDASREEVEADVIRFLLDLRERDLVVDA